jgi:hypothetical protein
MDLEEKDQIVYVLINEAMPGYAKIGRTTNLEQRIRGLDTTSVPLPFECVYAAKVADASFVERKLHDAFGDNRVRSNREFFEISPERIIAALQIGVIEEVTPSQDYVETVEDKKALDKARDRRSAFNFAMVNIPMGSTLTFSRDENVTCIVLDNKNVEFEGEKTSLSSAALTVLHRLGGTTPTAQGPLYWEYEGEILSERRKRMEEAD